MTDRGRRSRLDALPGRELHGGLRVVEAHGRTARARGLARLDAMPPAVALHIPRCRSVHTFGMRFALDLVWLAGGEPVRIDRSVRPGRVRSCQAADAVVEANAGEGDAVVAVLRRGRSLGGGGFEAGAVLSRARPPARTGGSPTP